MWIIEVANMNMFFNHYIIKSQTEETSPFSSMFGIFNRDGAWITVEYPDDIQIQTNRVLRNLFKEIAKSKISHSPSERYQNINKSFEYDSFRFANLFMILS